MVNCIQLIMQPFYSILILALTFSNTSQAQTSKAYTIFYAKDSSSIIKLHSYLKTVFVFSCPKDYNTTIEMPLELSLNGVSITLPTQIEKASDQRKIVFGELPPTLFNTKFKGHITFGKAILTALDSAGSDSTITIATKALIDANVSGPLYLDLKKWPGTYGSFWNEVEYYWLLDKQLVVQDSIAKLNASNARAKSLMNASNKYLTATAEQIKIKEKELSKKFSQFNSTVESLRKINARIDESFEKSKAGEKLTAEEKKQIAFLTADGNKIKDELKQQPDGKFALAIFEEMSKSITQNRAAQKQYDNANSLYQTRAKRLNYFKTKGKGIQDRIDFLKTRLVGQN